MDYFSDRELGSRTRIEQQISPKVWAAIVGLVQALLESGAFAQSFPENCLEGNVIAGTNESALAAQIVAEMPGLEWPLKTDYWDEEFYESKPFLPNTFLILDLIEYIFREIAQPIQGYYHDYHRHHHLSFDKKAGQDSFCETINRLFARNGIAYELQSNGQIKRVLSEQLEGLIRSANVSTGDKEFDRMMAAAFEKFTMPDPAIRYESLEKLWDAWERLKTFANPNDKKKSMTLILEDVASEPNFREILNEEANRLSNIGNAHLIRHSEKIQNPLSALAHVDYLFHRLLSMINLLLPSAITLHSLNNNGSIVVVF